jgi:Uncharacterised protein family (UPF0203)
MFFDHQTGCLRSLTCTLVHLVTLQWYKNRFLQGDVGGAETCHSLLLDWKECVSIAVEDHEAAERVAVKQATTSSAGDKKGS